MERKITTIAMITAVIVALLLPAFYYIISYKSQSLVLKTEVAINAQIITELINNNPDLWLYETARMASLLHHNHHHAGYDEELRRVYDVEGNVVVETGPELTSLYMTASADLYDFGQIVGRLTFSQSIRELIYNTVIAGMVGLMIGWIIYFSLKKYPLRALREAVNNAVILESQRADAMAVAKQAAEEGSRAKSQFLSRMSHEFRTPLNAIIGFSQVLELDAEHFDDAQKDGIREISLAGHHLLSLTNEILDLEKILAGKMILAMSAVSLDELLPQCISLLKPQAALRQISFEDNISNNGYCVQGDSTRIRQVLLNLLSNAVKYNNDQGTIGLNCELVGAQRLRICVTDRGEGLSEDDIARLFVPFERLASTGNVDGAGIGLVISRYLVELMGGTIGVRSARGEGSTFWVELGLSNKI